MRRKCCAAGTGRRSFGREEHHAEVAVRARNKGKMGNWLTRFPNTCIGVLWPAYMTYKALARAGNEAADIAVAEHSRWLRYWVLYGMMSIAEGPCDVFLSIVPGYTMAKLALLYWMAHPQTKGSEWMYENVASDMLQRNEMQIDAFALQVRRRSKPIDYVIILRRCLGS